jgi:DNA-binding response OmpR family regulator
MERARVLVVEDDAPLRGAIARGLTSHDIAVTTAEDGAGALREMARIGRGVSVVVLDIGLPDSDGRDVCQAIRARGFDVPVLFLTARGHVDDLVSGFAVGGDDYLTKPFHFVELLARVTALARRAAPDGATGMPHLDPARHALVIGDQEVRLTPTEYRILATLMGAPGKVVRRGELRAAAWPAGAVVQDNTLDQYVARLRRKLAATPGVPTIHTVHGVGYELL